MNPIRRELTQTQWLNAMGVDPFWIVEDQPPASTAPSTAEAPQAQVESASDWDALEGQIRSCKRCDLCQGRKQAVPGSGDRHADWLLVGEAPGAEEDMSGLPFVGQAGKLLDAMMAALDLKRDQRVYLANAVKCRPPENRTPDSREIDACNAFLDQQIGWIQPKVILALGRSAAYAVLGQEASIQTLRGRVHYRQQGDQKIPVVVTYHPAYLLRQPAEKWKVWQDLLMADSTQNSPP